MSSSSAFPFQVYHVIKLEPVVKPPVFVIEILFDFSRREIGCYVGKLLMLRPYLGTGVKEILDENFRVSSEMEMRLQSNIIQTYIYRIAVEAFRALFVVGVPVEMVVLFIAVNNLCNR
jgi:hypothetical protein